jgi:hypothetical protein
LERKFCRKVLRGNFMPVSITAAYRGSETRPLTARERLERARNNRLQQEDARQAVRPAYAGQIAYNTYRAAESAAFGDARYVSQHPSILAWKQRKQQEAYAAFRAGEVAEFGSAAQAQTHPSLQGFSQNLQTLRQETEIGLPDDLVDILAPTALPLDHSTEEAIDAFLEYVYGQGYAEEEDRDYEAVLAELVRLTRGQGESWDSNNMLRLLLESGALDGRGFSEHTLDYLTGDFNYQFSHDRMGQLEQFQWFLAEELYGFVEQGLISEDVLPYVEDAMIDQKNVAVLMALYGEALEQMSPEQRVGYVDYEYLSTDVPQFFFASQTENLYPEDPYSHLLLTAMSFFPVLSDIAAVVEFVQALQQPDTIGTVLSVIDIFTPGRLRAVGEVLGFSDEGIGILRFSPEGPGGRNAPDEPPSGGSIPGANVPDLPTTSGGRRVTPHAEANIDQRFGGNTNRIDEIIDNPSQVYTQVGDGSTVYVRLNQGRNRTYDVVIVNDNDPAGSTIVTVIRVNSPHELDRLAQRYGWTAPDPFDNFGE